MIEWTPSLSTGNEVLDEQHKALFRWLAELDSAANDSRTLFGAYAITRLKTYTRNHFAAEEALMKASGYPALGEHIAEHEAFRARLAELHLQRGHLGGYRAVPHGLADQPHRQVRHGVCALSEEIRLNRRRSSRRMMASIQAATACFSKRLTMASATCSDASG